MKKLKLKKDFSAALVDIGHTPGVSGGKISNPDYVEYPATMDLKMVELDSRHNRFDVDSLLKNKMLTDDPLDFLFQYRYLNSISIRHE